MVARPDFTGLSREPNQPADSSADGRAFAVSSRRSSGSARRPKATTKPGVRFRRSTTWPVNCKRAGTGSSISRRLRAGKALRRKMAHELKNSLTPIRLTVEEIAAREVQADRQFMNRAVQIVVEEIETLERRVRAFSEFSSEPESRPVTT